MSTEKPMFSLDEFAGAMSPGGPERPVSWVSWWQAPKNYEYVIPGVGIVEKISEDAVPSTMNDSYSYDTIYDRTMIFRVSSCGDDRYFRVEATSSSYESSDEAWEGAYVHEVKPTEQRVTRWVVIP